MRYVREEGLSFHRIAYIQPRFLSCADVDQFFRFVAPTNDL